MPYDEKRDTANYRACVDILDPHNGIGALCGLDLDETPMAVMAQGQRAAAGIKLLRDIIQDLKYATPDGVGTEAFQRLADFEEKARAERESRLETYNAQSRI